MSHSQPLRVLLASVALALAAGLVTGARAQTDLRISFSENAESQVVLETSGKIFTMPWKPGRQNIVDGDLSWQVEVDANSSSLTCKSYRPSNVLIIGRSLTMPAQGELRVESEASGSEAQVKLVSQCGQVKIPSFHPLYADELQSMQSLNNLIRKNTAKVAVVLKSSPAEGGKVDGAGVYTLGSLVRFSAAPADGYEFSHWESTPWQDISGHFALKNNVSGTAVFRKLEPIVVKDSDGKVLWRAMVPSGSVQSVEPPQVQGKIFKGWKGQGKEQVVSVLVKQPVELVAIYVEPKSEIGKVTLKAKPSNVAETFGGGEYKLGSMIHYSAVSVRPNYVFSKWEGAPWKTEAGDHVVSGDLVATAVFDEVFPVKLWHSDGTILSRRLKLGEMLEFAAPILDGKEFLGWSGDLEGKPQKGKLKISKSVESEAKYLKLDRVVVKNNVNQEDVLYSLKKGTVTKLEAPKIEGYEFDSWCVGSKDPILTAVVNGDKTYTASYRKLLELKLHHQPADLKVDFKGAGFHREGTIVDVVAPELEGYEFLQWDGDLKGKSSQDKVAMIKPMEATAYYRKLEKPETSVLVKPYKINTGDLVIATHSGTVQTAKVDWQGRALVLPAGRLKVFGLTQAEVERLVYDEMTQKTGRDTAVTVTITPGGNNTVSVQGGVNKPNRYMFSKKVTLADMVVAAGNFSSQADRNNIVIRGEGKVAYVRYDQAKDKELDPGDEVIIGELNELQNEPVSRSAWEPIALESAE